MSISAGEVVSCLKVLVAVAKADGKVQLDEKKSLASAIAGFEAVSAEEGFELPAGTSVDELLAASIDVATELSAITSLEARSQLYRSAHFLANADGHAAPQERQLLSQIEAALDPDDALRAEMARLGTGEAPRGGAFVAALRGIFRRS